jgi:hypothetical protein
MTVDGPELPEECCMNCHFLRKNVLIGKAEGSRHELSSADRAALRRCRGRESAEAFAAYTQAFLCLYDVVSTMDKRLVGAKENIPRDLTADRRDQCFFYPFHEGMSFETAQILEMRAANRREAERDRALTRRAFWVAFAALVVSIMATIASIVVQLATTK